MLDERDRRGVAKQFAAQIDGLNQAGAGFTTNTAAELERQVLGKLADWQAVMRQEAPEARQYCGASCATPSP